MIKSLLQVDPKNRPLTMQIMHMPVFSARYNEIREEKARDLSDSINENIDLLGTIKVPRNMSLLSARLPKSNYGVKLRSSEDVISTASSAFIKSQPEYRS